MSGAGRKTQDKGGSGCRSRRCTLRIVTTPPPAEFAPFIARSWPPPTSIGGISGWSFPARRIRVEQIGDFGRIYSIHAPKSPFIDSAYRLLLPHLYALPYRSRLRRILEEERPDLVEICDKYTLCYLPTIWRNGWDDNAHPAVFVGLSCERMDDNVSAFLSEGSLGRRFAHWYMRAIYAPRFDGHISNSEYTAAELVAALAKCPDLPVHVCPMGADCEKFGPQRRHPAKRAGLLAELQGLPRGGEDTRLLLYVGRLSREKNISLLVDMMELLSRNSREDYALLILGQGRLENWIRTEMDRRAGGRARLLGHVSDRERVADIFANCDALIHPNPREPFGIAPLEAMASGLPVVAPLSGGVLSYANAANAWLAEPNGASFAAAVHSVFGDDLARRQKIQRALDTAGKFNWAGTAARFFDLYDSLFARLRSSPPAVQELAGAAAGELMFDADASRHA